jgi:DNA-binding NarL/FixJ family response regulator
MGATSAARSCYAPAVPIRVVIADDHPLIADALAHILESTPGFELLARCATGDEALATVRKMRPDVAILDLRMPGLTGLEVLRELRGEGSATRVVLLTADISDEETLEAVRLGVGGVVLKGSPSQQLLHAVRTVAAGGSVVDEQSIRGALDRMLRREAGVAEVRRLLTAREIEIVKMVATGLRNKEIADKLSISESTVKIHLHSVYQKLGVSGRVELSNYVHAHSLV